MSSRDRICADHDIVIRIGDDECPTCREIRYPKEEMDALRSEIKKLHAQIKDITGD